MISLSRPARLVRFNKADNSLYRQLSPHNQFSKPAQILVIIPELVTMLSYLVTGDNVVIPVC